MMKNYDKKEIDNDGTIEYTLNGQLHRTDGPAIEYANGDKYWYINGQRHRDNGPAVEYAHGTKCWYINGKCHRENGPAIEFANGYKSWYINGKYYSEQEFNDYIKNQNRPCLGKKIVVDGVEYELGLIPNKN